jgi:hypothetical protein
MKYDVCQSDLLVRLSSGVIYNLTYFLINSKNMLIGNNFNIKLCTGTKSSEGNNVLSLEAATVHLLVTPFAI